MVGAKKIRDILMNRVKMNQYKYPDFDYVEKMNWGVVPLLVFYAIMLMISIYKEYGKAIEGFSELMHVEW